MSLPKAAIIAGIASIVVNVILLTLLKPFTDVPDTFMTLTMGPVITWSIIGTVGATIVYALMRKFSTNPKGLFGIVSFVVLLLSFIPDVLIHGMTSGPFVGATWSAVLLLMLMHVVVASFVVYLFLKKTG
jgi:hypothetical protein